MGWPLFVFSDTLSSVLIIDHSHADITIGSIDVVVPVSVATEPIVWLLSRGGTNFDTLMPLQFDLTRGAVETWIDIQKRATGRLVIAGPVNNPTGWTHILHTDGDIESAVGGSSIITNALHLEAPKGGIGTVANRLGVTLVQSVDRLRPRTLDDRLRTTFLRATARDTVALHLHGVDRVPLGQPRSGPPPSSCTWIGCRPSWAVSTCCSRTVGTRSARRRGPGARLRVPRRRRPEPAAAQRCVYDRTTTTTSAPTSAASRPATRRRT